MFKFKKVKGDFGLSIFKSGEHWLDESTKYKVGEFFIDALREEIQVDRDKIGQLPETERFEESFEFQIKGDEIVVSSTWPWVERYVEGRDAFPMDWLTRSQGAYKVPIMQKDGTVVVRMAPLTLQDAWIHPAIAKHNFIQRATDRTLEYLAELQLEVMFRTFKRK